MPKPGGYGREAYGDPFGAGGPLYVVRALAVAGQVVRVVFDEAPLANSPAGQSDALNPSNYLFDVVAGQATAPTAVGANAKLVVGPTNGVGNGTAPGAPDERAVDVHVDRQLIVGITYRVTVRAVLSALGIGLGAPYAASFPGVTKLSVVRPQARNQDLVDIGNPPFVGTWSVDDSGDLALDPSPDAGTRKRVLRRITTPFGAFSFLNGYGGRIRIKGVAGLADMAAWKDDMLQQILLEPDVVDAANSVSIDPSGVLTVDVKARTRRGQYLTLTQKFAADGTPMIG